MSRNFRNFVFLLLSGTTVVRSSPRLVDGGFIPSSMIYLEESRKSPAEQPTMPSQVDLRSETTMKRDDTNANDITNRIQEPRFGFTNIASTGSGYGASTYAPAKIDLGGLLLGAIIGVGSILIIPKLLYVLSGTYGHYARSEENGVSEIVTKLDDVLARHGIDSTSCMQRAVCSYSQRAAASSTKEAKQLDDDQQDEQVSSLDRMVDAITTNRIFRTAMEGTAIQEAVEAGRTGRNCSKSYPHCGFSMETILSLVSNLMTAVAAVNAVPSTTATLS
ncbi:uncharacterized protein LOC143350020 [Colletes latitarsis]|uniref:uncharacterized protein LOC143350020 n=1 Tax=Colletes latitarsis TaxID=2605962 RepID=UPI0040362F3F